MNVTQLFLEHLETMQASTLPTSVFSKARQCLIDYLAVTTAGARLTRERWDAYLHHDKEVGHGAPIMGRAEKVAPLDAALINGFNAHVLELDDGHRFGMMHPGAAVISALLAIEPTRRFTLDAFYQSMVIGYEAAVKLARAVQPEAKLRGFHATGICGTVGAAMAVSHALSYNRKQTMSALAAAATSASGLLEVIEDDSELKPYNAGKAAMSGLQAALFGAMAFEAPRDVLGGERGFISVVSGKQMTEVHFAAMLETAMPEIEGVYFKPYGACRHCHPAIEAALTLKDSVSDLNEVADILVETYQLAVRGHERQEVNSLSAAKMSTPYCVADALVFGPSNVLSYSQASLQDARLRQLLPKISVVEDEVFSQKSPDMRSARVTIQLSDGRRLTQAVDHPKGEPENPMTEDALWQKMTTLLARGPAVDVSAVLRSLEDHHGDLENVLRYFVAEDR